MAVRTIADAAYRFLPVKESVSFRPGQVRPTTIDTTAIATITPTGYPMA